MISSHPRLQNSDCDYVTSSADKKRRFLCVYQKRSTTCSIPTKHSNSRSPSCGHTLGRYWHSPLFRSFRSRPLNGSWCRPNLRPTAYARRCSLQCAAAAGTARRRQRATNVSARDAVRTQRSCERVSVRSRPHASALIWKTPCVATLKESLRSSRKTLASANVRVLWYPRASARTSAAGQFCHVRCQTEHCDGGVIPSSAKRVLYARKKEVAPSAYRSIPHLRPAQRLSV
jgi:hypothetical protein